MRAANTSFSIAEFKKSITQLNGEGHLLRQKTEAWLTEFFGERCKGYCEGCECCERWKALDRLFEKV